MMAQASQILPSLSAAESSDDTHNHDFYGTITSDRDGLILCEPDREDLHLMASARAVHFKDRAVHVRGIMGACNTLLAWSIEPV
jgi:hypothetical protein